MSFFKRLSNVGKGVWKVNMGPRDPDEERRIQALQADMAQREAKTTPSRGLPSVDRPGSVKPDPDADLDARLDLLAADLREGRLSREEYDRATEDAIRKATGEAEPLEPGPAARRTL